MIDPTALPMRYDELPELGDLGVRHAWNVWPNSLGTLNRMTRARRERSRSQCYPTGSRYREVPE